MIRGAFHLIGMVFLMGLAIGSYIGYQAGSTADPSAGCAMNMGHPDR